MAKTFVPQGRIPYTTDTLKSPYQYKVPFTQKEPIPIPDINNFYRKYRYSQKANYPTKESNFLDYNDTSQINSAADIILKNLNVNTKQTADSNILKDIFNYIRDSTFKPLLEGDGWAVVSNTLINIGETMDIPSNILKGAIFKSGSVKGALGYYDRDGVWQRNNYDVDTGNLALDIIGEIIIDPMNWITFGQMAVAKTTASALSDSLKVVAKEVAENSDEIISSKSFRKLAKKAVNAYVDGDYDTMTKAVNNVLSDMTSKSHILKKAFGSDLTTDEAMSIMKKMQKSTVSYNADIVLDSFKKFVKPMDLDNFNFKMAMSGQGIYPTFKLMGKGFNMVNSMVQQSRLSGAIEAIKDYTKLDGSVNILKYEEALKSYLEHSNVTTAFYKLKEVHNTPESIFQYAIDISVHKDLANIKEIFDKYADKPLEFNKALTEALELPQDLANPLDYYLEELTKINKKSDTEHGKFDEIVDYLIELSDVQRSRIRYATAELEHKINVQTADAVKKFYHETYSGLYTDYDKVVESVQALIKPTNRKLELSKVIDELEYTLHLEDKNSITFLKYLKLVKEQIMNNKKLTKADMRNVHREIKLASMKFLEVYQEPNTIKKTFNLAVENFKKNFYKGLSSVELREEYLKHFNEENIISPLKQIIEFATQQVIDGLDVYRDMYLMADEINPLIDSVTEALLRYSKDLIEQLNTTFKKDLTKALYESSLSDAEFPTLDFSKLSLFSSFKTKFNNLLERLERLSTPAPELKDKMVSSSEKFLKTSDKNNKTVEFIMQQTDKAQKELKAEFGISEADAAKVKAVKKTLVQTIPNPENFIEYFGDVFSDLYRDDFVNDYYRFLNAQNAQELTDAWLSLNRAFNSITETRLKPEAKVLNPKARVTIQAGSKLYPEEGLAYVADSSKKLLSITVDESKKLTQLESTILAVQEVIKNTKPGDLKKNQKFWRDLTYIVNTAPGAVQVQHYKDEIATLQKLIKKTPEGTDEFIKFNQRLDELLKNPIQDIQKYAFDLKRRMNDLKPTSIIPRKVRIVNPKDENDIWLDIGPLINSMQELNPFKMMDAEITIKADTVYYQYKLEQVNTMLQLMNVTSVTELFAGMERNTGLGAILNNLSNAILPNTDPLFGASQAAKQLNYYREHYNNYKLFLDLVANVPMNNAVKGTFYSSLMKWSNINVNDFLNNLDHYTEEIFKDTDTFSLSKITTMPSLSLDAYREKDEIKELLDKMLPEELKNMKAHTALYDCYTDEAVLEYEGIMEKIFNDPNFIYIFFDTETFGIKANQGAVFEIGMKEYKKQGTQFNLMLKSYDVEQQATRGLLKKFGYTSDADFYIDRGGDILTEKLLLQNFIDKLKTYQGKAVLIGQNSDRFDVDFLIKRMYYNGISSYDIQFFENIKKYDGLTYLRKKYGAETLGTDAKYRLKKLLTNYAMSQSKAGVPRLISPNNGGIGDALNTIKKAIIENTKGDNFSSKIGKIAFTYDDALMFGDIASDIFNVLRNIRSTNKILGTHLIVPELFDLSDNVHKNLIVNMSEYLGKTLNEDEIKTMTQLLYSYSQDFVGLYGYKKIIDANILSDWTTITEGDNVSLKLAKSLTSLGKALQRTKDAIKNVDILQGRKEDFDRVINLLIPNKFVSLQQRLSPELMRSGIPVENIGKFYTHLRKDYTDTLSSFVMAQYMYNVYKNRGLLIEAYTKHIGAETLEFLENTSEIYNRALRLAPTYKLLEIDSDVAKPNQLDAVMDYYNKSTVSPLENMGKLFEDEQLFRGKTLEVTQNLIPTKNMLELYNKRILELSENPYDQKKYIDSLRTYTDNLAIQQLNQVLNFDISNLFSYLVHNTPWVEFSKIDVEHDITLQNSFMALLERIDTFKEMGIIMTEDKESGKIYLYLDKKIRDRIKYVDENDTINYYLDGELINKPILSELDLESASKYLDDEEMLDALTKVRNTIHNLSGNASIGTLGDTVTPVIIRKWYEALPDAVKKELPPISELANNKLYENLRYNHTNIGTMASRRIKQETSMLPTDEGFVPKTVVSIYKKNSEITASMSKTKIQYAHLYFGKEFSINNSAFFSGASDDDIIKAFKKRPEFILSALVEDKKYGYKVVHIQPTSKGVLAEARRLNAVVLPYHVAKKASKVINQDMMSDYRRHWWNKLLYVYKVGYLLDPAVWLRNAVDSTLKTIGMTNSYFETLATKPEAIKDLQLYDKIVHNVMMLDKFDLQKVVENGLEEAVENAIKQNTANEMLTAMAILNKYNDTLDDISKMDRNNKFRLDNLKFYYEKMHPELDYDVFQFLHGFLVDGPSAGMTKSWVEAWGEDESKSLWGMFVNLTGKLMNPNSQIEQINRLTEYLILARHGDDSTKAFYKIVKTHFDYADKAPWEIYTELVFPFYSFTMKNLEYWLDIIEKNPSLIRQLENVMTPVFDFDSYDYNELAFNKSLQNQILAGNIPLNNNGLTLKMSPSFMDSLNLILNPLDNGLSKMLAPVKDLGQILIESAKSTDYTIPEESDKYGEVSMESLIYDTVPILGTFLRKYMEQGDTYYERTNNPVNKVFPGLFGGTQRWQAYTYKNYPKGRYPEKAPSEAYKRWQYYMAHKDYYDNLKAYYSGNKKYTINKNIQSKTYAAKSYTRRQYNKWVYPNSNIEQTYGFYKKHYNKKGKSRLRALMLPNSGQQLKYKIVNTQQYYR